MSFNPSTVMEAGKWSGYESTPISQKGGWGFSIRYLKEEALQKV